MSRVPVEITETYTPGKNLGRTRTITVERIPATEVTYDDGVTEAHLTFDVAYRVEYLTDRALESNDLPDQSITYTPWPPGEPREPLPWRAATASRASSPS
jgi:hypothetical protein